MGESDEFAGSVGVRRKGIVAFGATDQRQSTGLSHFDERDGMPDFFGIEPPPGRNRITEGSGHTRSPICPADRFQRTLAAIAQQRFGGGVSRRFKGGSDGAMKVISPCRPPELVEGEQYPGQMSILPSSPMITMTLASPGSLVFSSEGNGTTTLESRPKVSATAMASAS